MSEFAKMKLVKIDPTQQIPKDSVKGKLIASLQKQLVMAEDYVAGKGIPKTPSGKLTKTWWFEVDNVVYLQLYLLNSKVDLGDGKNAIEVGKIDNLPAIIKKIIRMVEDDDAELKRLLNRHLIAATKARKEKKAQKS